MFVVKKLKDALAKLSGFFQYHYASSKNHYLYKLLGEKHAYDTNNTIIVFRKLGEKQPIEMPVKELLAAPHLIAHIHPKEALKIGSIALEEFIVELPENSRKQQFNKMKNIMLNSTHSLSNNESGNSPLQLQHLSPAINIKNTYPFKLVGGKSNNNGINTTITYTILGKREGHEKKLHELVNNIELIEKFHPTEAIKFGFIALGDSLFSSSQTEKTL